MSSIRLARRRAARATSGATALRGTAAGRAAGRVASWWRGGLRQVPPVRKDTRMLALTGLVLLAGVPAAYVVVAHDRVSVQAWVVLAGAAFAGWLLLVTWVGRSVDLLRATLLREAEHRTTAEALQRSLAPARLPEVPGLRLAARYLPGTRGAQVGGDWYDAFDLPTGEVGLVVGDVAGHDLPAAAAMAQLRNALRAYALEDGSPASVLTRLNHAANLLDVTEMATCIYAVLDPATLSLRWSSAGHLPPVVASGNGVGRLLTHEPGAPLGVTAAPEYEDHQLRLRPGEALMLFSDGLVERRGTSIDVSLAELAAITSPVHCPETLCDRLLESRLDDRTRYDDVTLLLVRT